MSSVHTNPNIETDVLEEEIPVEITGAKLIIYNDDVNTFDWVIECLIRILKHTEVQAEQLSLMIHFKGKAIVKQGDKKELMPYKNSLTDCGLSAIIEE
jgi:ATP-dependent Clp protease adaptor protein ClpS